jgi:hypothetical protein
VVLPPAPGIGVRYRVEGRFSDGSDRRPETFRHIGDCLSEEGNLEQTLQHDMKHLQLVVLFVSINDVKAVAGGTDLVEIHVAQINIGNVQLRMSDLNGPNVSLFFSQMADESA